MNVKKKKKNIVHRILAIQNEQLLSQIEALLDNDVYTYTTSGKPLSTAAYKNHLTEIMNFSETVEIGYTTEEAKKKINRK